MNNENNLSKSSPEFSFFHKVRAFLDGDPDFSVSEINGSTYDFTISVKDYKKYTIFKKAFFVPPQARRLNPHIEYVDDDLSVSDKDLAYMLSTNPHFYDFLSTENPGLPLMSYILMKPEVVQYYDDIFNNPNGCDTKTAEQLAKEIFHGFGCNITTYVK